MTRYSYKTDSRDYRRDAAWRHMIHGPIQPLYRPTLIERMFGRG